MADQQVKCTWCGVRRADPHIGYCSGACIQAERAQLFARDKGYDEKWVHFGADIPPELARMLDRAHRKALGVNALAATRAGLVRSALRLWLDTVAPVPKLATEDSIDSTAVEIDEARELEHGQRGSG